jgi:hypothetical protein
LEGTHQQTVLPSELTQTAGESSVKQEALKKKEMIF